MEVNLNQRFHNVFAIGCPDWGRKFDKKWDIELLKRLYDMYNCNIDPSPPAVMVILKEISFNYGNPDLNCIYAYATLEWASDMKLHAFATKHKAKTYHEHFI